MRKLILMTSAAVIAPISAIAQTPTCTATPDCASLGYTQSSCPENNGVRCPWGDKWFCTKTCSEMGFNYTCSGTGYAGGAGSACGGKYASCECYAGFEWKNGQGCVESSTECKLGAILYSDKTCSSSGYDNDVGAKKAIGVVVYIGSDGKRWAMALKSIGSYMWSKEYVDISGLTNYTSQSSASQDYASCENSAKIRAQGNSSTYPAVWAVYNYTTTGTKVGDWCLPAAGIFTSIYNNQSTINTGFSRANGTQFTSSTYAWSSSEYNKYNAWYSHFYGGLGYDGKNYDYSKEVRPVLAF